jgi:uncharacterized repeat protein (TIGR02543 family)
VYINGGTFTLSGGKISNNANIGASTARGGGVNINGGTFIMSGGEISGNTASGGSDAYGGGVYIFPGVIFTKEPGGIIYGSDADSTLQNTVVAPRNAVGHAMYTPTRNSTMEEGETLDSTKSGAAGGWVDRWAVTFDTDGGAPVTQPAKVSHGSSLGASMPPDPARDGYAFGGWYTAQNGEGTQFTATTTVTKAVTVYANWQYTVTFDFDDGTSVTETRAVNSGDPVDAAMPADPTRSDYTFGGWYTAQNGEGTQFAADTPVTGNIRVYALWLP